MTTGVREMLGVGGAIAARLGEHYEPREPQLAMAEAVERCMAGRGRLLVEAGTGVGKSFAYLLPAIRRIVEHGERVVVATNTIALQEQLLEKDVPLLRAATPDEFSAVLVKGRGNYLSIRRLQLASKRQERLFADAASRQSLHQIEDWAYTTTDGTLTTLPQLDRAGVWDRVRSDSGNCMGRRCPSYEACFYQQARRRMEHGQLLICNHALFFSDLALRSAGVGFLPAYDHVVLDEAHGVEDVATEHFGASLAESRVHHLLSMLLHEKTGKGFLGQLQTTGDESDLKGRALARTSEAADAARVFFDEWVRYAGGGTLRSMTKRVREAGVVDNIISPAFAQLAMSLRRVREVCASEEDAFELSSYAERAQAVAVEAQLIVDQELDGCAYWVEVSPTPGARSVRVTIAGSPVDVGPVLREKLFAGDHSVTLTSATLTTGSKNQSGAFRHIASRIGFDLEGAKSETLALGSPFEYASQVELYVESSMPDPRDPSYDDALTSKVIEHVSATGGGAFVLFTSLRTLSRVASLTRGELGERGIGVFAQGEDGPRSLLLQKFRASEKGALFGAASFWQGVDVRGAALRNVIITRLPFEPPDRPIVEARCEMIEARGGNAFMEDSVPRAVIRFKQGFGRLIRSSGDSGRVVVLDPRVVTKRYGALFLRALPEGVEVVRDPIE